jgi:hypothetical protein
MWIFFTVSNSPGLRSTTHLKMKPHGQAPESCTQHQVNKKNAALAAPGWSNHLLYHWLFWVT